MGQYKANIHAYLVELRGFALSKESEIRALRVKKLLDLGPEKVEKLTKSRRKKENFHDGLPLYEKRLHFAATLDGAPELPQFDSTMEVASMGMIAEDYHKQISHSIQAAIKEKEKKLKNIMSLGR